MTEYVDVRQLHPAYEEKECWNCGNTWLRYAHSGESICHECFMGQGDHETLDEPTDYGELWYGDISRDAMQAAHSMARNKSRHITADVTVRL